MRNRALLLCFSCLTASAGIQVLAPVEHQVIQRSGTTAGIRISGSSTSGKAVEARLLSAGKPLSGLDWKTLEPVAGGTWSGLLSGVPAGGPYTLEVRASGENTVQVGDLLVGDLWILAGQSNMEGVGDLVDVQAPDPQVHSFTQQDIWEVAREPLHEVLSASDPIHWKIRKRSGALAGEELTQYRAARTKGAGLGLPFAVEMVRRTGIPVGLLPCAHGGTSMDQWNPGLRDQGGESLYGAMVRRFQAAGGRVAGVLWYQGEAEASVKNAALFPEKFARLVSSIRADFRQPDLPFYYVQIGRFINGTAQKEWNQVQEAQRLAESAIPNSGMVTAVDLSLDDLIHAGTQDLKLLGHRLALLATRTGKRGPRPSSVKLEKDRIRVSFTEVNGSLRSEGRIGGFAVLGADGEPVPAIYKSVIDPADSSAVLLYITGELPGGAALRYGFGKDPYCNLRDESGMGAPAFGPIPILP